MANDKRRKSSNILLQALHGRLLSTDFFARNWVTIAAIMAMFLIYITNRYQCMTRMETIQELEHQLEVIQTERVLQQSLYMSQTRESAMRELVDTMHLGLSAQTQPPFRLSLDK